MPSPKDARFLQETIAEIRNDLRKRIKESQNPSETEAWRNEEIVSRIAAAREFRKKQGYDDLIRRIRLFLSGRGWETVQFADERMFEAMYGNRKESEWPQLIQNVKSSMINIDMIGVTCVPISVTDKAKGTAAVLGDVISALFSDGINKRELQKAKVESRGLPLSITGVFVDDGIEHNLTKEGYVYFKNIPIEKFWWEPSATDLNKCEYVFVGDIYGWNEVLGLKGLPGFDGELIQRLHDAAVRTARGQTSSMNPANAPLREINNHAFEYFRHIDENVKATDLQHKVPMDHYYVRSKENGKWVVHKHYVLFQSVVVGREKLKITTLPFAALKEYNLEGSFYGRSSVEIALPNIEALMKLDAQIATTVANNFSPMVVIPEGLNAQEFLDARQKGTVVTAGIDLFAQTGGKILFDVPPYRIDEQILALRQLLLEELQTIVGINQITLGEGFGSATNGSAVNSMIAQSTARDYDAIQEFGLYLHRLALLVVDALSNDYLDATDQKYFFIPQNGGWDFTKKDAFKPVTLSKEDLQEGVGAIIINTETLKVNRKEAQLQNLLTLLQISLQNPQRDDALIRVEDIVPLIDVPHKKEILQRITDQTDIMKIAEYQLVIDKVKKLMQLPQGELLDPQIAAMLIHQEVKSAKEAAMNGQQAPQSQIDEQAMLNEQMYEQAVGNYQTPAMPQTGQGTAQQQAAAEDEAFIDQAMAEGQGVS